MNPNRVVLLLMWLVFLPPPLAAGTENTYTLLDQRHDKIEPDQIHYAIDSGKQITIEDRADLDFSAEDFFPNLGYLDAAVWYKVDVRNAHTQEATWILRSGVRFMRPGEIFLERAGQVERILYSEDDLPFHERPIQLRHLAVPVTLAPSEAITIYIRFQAGGTSIFPFHFVKPATMYRDEGYALGLTSSVIAILLTLITVNFFHYLALRQDTYLLYCFQELSIGLYLIHMAGYGFQYLWPELPQFNAIASPFIGAISIGFALLFASVFLELKSRFPVFNRGVQVAVILIFLVAIASLFVNIRLLNQFTLLIGTIVGVMTVLVSLYLFRKGFVPAGYYFAAWIVRMFGSLGFAATLGGIMETPSFDPLDQLEVAVALQALIFSIGLASQHRRIAEENLSHQQLVVEQLTARLGEARDMARVEHDKEDALARVVESSQQLATTSHDIAQPIRSLRLAINQLKSDITDHELESAIIHTLDDMEFVLSDLLNDASTSIRDLTHEVEASLDEMLNELAVRYRELALAKGLYLRIYASDETVTLSSIALRRVLGNVIHNAIKFTDDGGVLLSARRRREGLLFQVWDTGAGMTNEEIDQYQQQFETSDGANGHGLGLAIVREICDQRGWISGFRSVPGSGTCFNLLVPSDSYASPTRTA